MRFPVLTIDLSKIEHNTKTMVKLCGKRGIGIAAVTKGYCALPEIAEASVRGGVRMLADSRIENLMKLRHLGVPKLLLRLPMLSQVEDVVAYSDISLNSEYETIKALSNQALKAGKIHKVILMVDLGDLREGVWRQDAVDYVEEILKLKGVELYGLGTNLTCFGAVLPSKENLTQLCDLVREIENRYEIHLQVVSGGNSSSIYLVQNGEIPDMVNHLRLGESILFGTEFAFGKRIDNTYGDAFKLYAEVVEIKAKPSVPIGNLGLDAFGEKPVFVDRGVRQRAILGIGKQDVRVDNLKPSDPGAMILGASSDHLILDITDSVKEYRMGDIVEFDIHYIGVLTAMTSEYVSKVPLGSAKYLAL